MYSMKTKVVVVIPNWNGQDFIVECLRSLEKQTLKPKIVVVDNGSVDDSVQIIKDEFSCLQHSSNTEILAIFGKLSCKQGFMPHLLSHFVLNN